MLMPFKVEMLINFVGYDDDIVLNAEIGEELQLGFCVDAPGWIVGRIEDHRARIVAEGGAQLLLVKCPIGRVHRHVNRLPASHLNAGHITVIIRLDNDDFVAGSTKPIIALYTPWVAPAVTMTPASGSIVKP